MINNLENLLGTREEFEGKQLKTNTTRETLKKLKVKLEEIAGKWNGDESGLTEDRANAAVEGISAINTLELILEELNLN